MLVFSTGVDIDLEQVDKMTASDLVVFLKDEVDYLNMTSADGKELEGESCV